MVRYPEVSLVAVACPPAQCLDKPAGEACSSSCCGCPNSKGVAREVFCVGGFYFIQGCGKVPSGEKTAIVEDKQGAGFVIKRSFVIKKGHYWAEGGVVPNEADSRTNSERVCFGCFYPYVDGKGRQYSDIRAA